MNTLLTGAVVIACALCIGSCGGSMGSDPAGTSGTTTPTASAQPNAASGSLAALMGAATPGTLSATGSGALTYAISTPAQNGTVTITNAATGAFTYTSYPNFSGRDSFQFTVANSSGTSQPATETVNVTSGALGAEQAVANVGVSLDWLCYWCTMQPFVNVTRQAASFTDNSTNVALIEEGKLDPDGWPEADFRWMVLCCTKADGSASDPGNGYVLDGNYQLSFNGIAAHIGDDGGTVQNQQYNATTNTTTATLDQTGSLMLLTFYGTQRTATSATNTGVTNIQIIRPQFAPNGAKWWDSPTQEFTDPFLASLKGFSTVRYMNYTGAIDSPETNWSDRTPGNWPVAGHLMEAAPSAMSYLTPAAASCTQYCNWYGTGGSWESVIQIANATHTDPWINIPTLATDDYVRSLAALFKADLDPGLHVYVEWSDEIWNYADPWWTETSYNAAEANALLASNPTEAANYAANCSGATNECHVAERVMQFGQDFASVYGAAAVPDSIIRPVLCTQVVQPMYLQAALKFIQLTYGPPRNYFYGTCGAPYWGAPSALPAGTTTSGAVAAIDSGITGNDTYIRTDTATDLYYGLHNLTYEGGANNTSFALTGTTSAAAVKALTAAVQMSPGMKADVINGLTNAFANGIDMYMYYENQSATLWGATIDPLDLQEPKFAGLTAVTGQLVTRSVGTTLPGNIPANPPDFTEQSGAIYPWAWPVMFCSSGGCALKSTATPGTGFGYLVNVPKAGTYSVSLVLSSNATPVASIALDVDQQPAGSFAVPQTAGGTPLTVGPVSVTLTTGLHLLEILQVGTYNFAASSITVAAQ